MPKDNTDSQIAVYYWVLEYKKQTGGASPTRQQIANGLGVSVSTVQMALSDLDKAGLLDMGIGRAKEISLTGEKYGYTEPDAIGDLAARVYRRPSRRAQAG